MSQKTILRATLLALLSITFYPAMADKNKRTIQFGSYTVHYNTLPTDFLSIKIAKQFKIVRSSKRILVNIAVKHNAKDSKTTAVPAKVTVRAHNMTGQLKYADMRAVHDGKAIYYIGEFSVANRERLNFTVTVTPKHKQASTYSFKFKKKFMTQ
ncbi:hypothetical protein MNBD_GAMMA12-1433 [hydrothermal vent metagenome]|uniref:DUF4426 domain-containing protein n=1 Tax=hydrothermal vent metagenome TaxID=652676 RepID=A0A3B0YQT7_9ZZZZ